MATSTLVVASARAAEVVGVGTLDYASVSDCPDRAEFLNQVRQRLDTLPDAQRDDDAQIAVRIERGRVAQPGRTFSGTVSFVAAGSGTTSRRVSGDNCAEVVAALALITALGIDSRAQLLTLGESAEAPLAEAEPSRATPPPARPVPLPRAAPGVAPVPRYELGTGIGLTSALSPDLNILVRSFAGVVKPHWGARLALNYAFAEPSRVALTRVQFDWYGVSGHFCGLSSPAKMRARVCGTLDAGYLAAQAESSASLDGRSSGSLWVAPGALGALDYGIASQLRLEASGGLFFPLLRERFTLRRLSGAAELVHETPWAGWLATLGVAYYLR